MRHRPVAPPACRGHGRCCLRNLASDNGLVGEGPCAPPVGAETARWAVSETLPRSVSTAENSCGALT